MKYCLLLLFCIASIACSNNKSKTIDDKTVLGNQNNSLKTIAELLNTEDSIDYSSESEALLEIKQGFRMLKLNTPIDSINLQDSVAVISVYQDSQLIRCQRRFILKSRGEIDKTGFVDLFFYKKLLVSIKMEFVGKNLPSLNSSFTSIYGTPSNKKTKKTTEYSKQQIIAFELEYKKTVRQVPEDYLANSEGSVPYGSNIETRYYWLETICRWQSGSVFLIHDFMVPPFHPKKKKRIIGTEENPYYFEHGYEKIIFGRTDTEALIDKAWKSMDDSKEKERVKEIDEYEKRREFEGRKEMIKGL